MSTALKTNTLAEAARLLENGDMWCSGAMLETTGWDAVKMVRVRLEQPKVCAVGAILAAQRGLGRFDLASFDTDQVISFEEEAWSDAMAESPEIKAMAEEITAALLPEAEDDDEREYLQDDLKVSPLGVVYGWNDEQPDEKPVIEMMRRAAARLETQND